MKVEKYPNGNFLAPTIIANMNTDMTAYKTEIFGPVLCVISVDTLEEAIEVSPSINLAFRVAANCRVARKCPFTTNFATKSIIDPAPFRSKRKGVMEVLDVNLMAS